MKCDNPAERLLSLLNEGKKITVSTKCRDAWGQLLDASPNSALLMSRLGKVMELPSKAILLLKENYEETQGTWSYWESTISNAFLGQNLNDQWQTFISKIDGHTINYLRLSSVMLDKAGAGRVIDQGDLVELRGKLQDIFDEIAESDIDFKLRNQLLHGIRKVLDALTEYQISGAEGIQDAVDAAVGHARFSEDYLDFMRGNAVGKRLAVLMSVIANVVTVATGLHPLGHDVGEMFGYLAEEAAKVVSN